MHIRACASECIIVSESKRGLWNAYSGYEAGDIVGQNWIDEIIVLEQPEVARIKKACAHELTANNYQWFKQGSE